jgi:hypothetical protein
VVFVWLAGAVCWAADAVPHEVERAHWRVRDVAANSNSMRADACGQLKLKLDAMIRPADVWKSSCLVSDLAGQDRAVTLIFSLPVPEGQWVWWDDPQRRREVRGEKVFLNTVEKAGGMHDAASLYPLAVISNELRSICVAVPVDEPRMVRFVMDPVRRELRAEFDLGLSDVPEKFKSRADASVMVWEGLKRWAFREGLARYYQLFPKAFERRVKEAGIWMPFADLRAVDKVKDFGFAFHEIADHQVVDVPSGRKLIDFDHGVACGVYAYVEPQTYWQEYRGKGKGTYEERLAQLETEANSGNPAAQGAMTSAVIRASGKRDIWLEDVAYTPQRPWGLNCSPFVPGDAEKKWLSKGQYEIERLEKLIDAYEPTGSKIDGVYVDSMEGWGEFMNFDKRHWKVTRHPLTFDPATKKVALLNFWGTVEWVREMSERLHVKKKALMGNDAYYFKWQLAPWVDVPGREYGWFEGEKFVPLAEERYLFLRAMANQRPYLMLMNNRFDRGEVMEKYFQRNLFYAVFPSMYYGHTSTNEVWYFSNPEWYNRDRKLFTKYVPMIRKLDGAGWEVVPYAQAEPEGVRVERYGSFGKGTLAFSVHHGGEKTREVTLRVMKKELGIAGKVKGEEWVSGKGVEVEDLGEEVLLRVGMEPDGYGVVALRRVE